MRFKNHYFQFFLLILCFSVNAQEYGTKIEGKVFSKDGDVAATHVSNISSNKGTIADAKGFFTISVKLNDTLVFSAIQYKRKELVVDLGIMETELISVVLEASLTELNEVIVMPYNLSGKLDKDIGRLKIGSIITASTEKLPNSDVIVLNQAERKLSTATDWDCNCQGSGLDPLLNYFSGRTKMLNERIARNSDAEIIKEVRKYYTDSLYIKDLKIPQKNIDDFVYFCELDSNFSNLIASQDKLVIWDFMKEQSLSYRKNNDLD